jgi:hypothetical protein
MVPLLEAQYAHYAVQALTLQEIAYHARLGDMAVCLGFRHAYNVLVDMVPLLEAQYAQYAVQALTLLKVA